MKADMAIPACCGEGSSKGRERNREEMGENEKGEEEEGGEEEERGCTFGLSLKYVNGRSSRISSLMM